MEVVIISLSAFIIALLTFFSGFGLGTLLTPVFMIFFPVDIAIGLTGVVHFFNNIFRLFLIGKHADKDVLLRFGIPSVLAAFAGAWLLLRITGLQSLYSYSINGRIFEVSLIKFIVSILLIFFASIELIPYFKNLQFGKKMLILGGTLSGFFGGLSGNQGPLRSVFLIKAGLSKEAYIATIVIISTFVDFTRLSVYATRFTKAGLNANLTLVVFATLAGIAGAYIGNKLLKKVTLRFLQITVAIMLIALSLALGTGLI